MTGDIREGWYAEQDPTAGRHPWEPCLQLNGFWIGGGIWFETEALCLEFIKTRVIGQQLLEHQ